MRVGFGYDAHRFVDGRPLVLGGVTVPWRQGLGAHSDGDVLLHALCDALLGAAALGDLGGHFPDDDPRYAGIDSRILLRRVRQLLAEHGLQVANLDLTVVAQAPRLAPHVTAMREHIAVDVRVPLEAAGHQFLHLIHMVRADGGDHDWRSYWATLTFRVRP